jgi:hypothetical protein
MKKSWRDVIKVHPAADVFPMLPEDELRKLGEDIKKNGLKEPVIVWSPGNRLQEDQPAYVLDGRNRLDAMELVGIKILDFRDKLVDWDGKKRTALYLYEYDVYGQDDIRPALIDPVAYVISKNIYRRHLTKEQQADLIVKAMNASTDFAKLARSVQRDSGGRVQGSTKDPVKKKIVEEATKHGISKRTVERAIAKDRGPIKTNKAMTGLVIKRKPKFDEFTTFTKGGQTPAGTKIDTGVIVVKVIKFLEREMERAAKEDFEELATNLQLQLTKFLRDALKKAPSRKLTSQKKFIREVEGDLNRVLNSFSLK